jgi:2-haloacid dehalogenase
MLRRRDLLAASGAALAASVSNASFGHAASVRAASGKIKAVGFDAFTIFNPNSVVAAVEENFPGKGAELSSAWRSRQFEYCWLRTLNRTYVDFWQVTEEALVFAAKAAKIDLKSDARARLMDAWLQLKPWPDSVAALRTMREAGVRLAYVSNMTPKMLMTNSENAGVGGLFESLTQKTTIARGALWRFECRPG